MYRLTSLLVLAGVLLVTDVANGAVAQGMVDTSDGFCHSEYGKVPIGETLYPTDQCVSVNCEPGIYHITGCSMAYTDDPNCKVVREKGQHPYCCPRIKCGDELNDSHAIEQSLGGVEWKIVP